MAENSNIEWTTHTMNPWRGCTKVSDGCAHCYAETLSGRNPKTLGVWGPNGTRVVAAEAQWKLPLKWNSEAGKALAGASSGRGEGEVQADVPARPRVFCASLADVFEDWTGKMVDASGLRCAFNRNTGSIKGCGRDLDELPLPEYRWATMQDVRARLFALIDATPNLDWLLLTKRPENITPMMAEFLGAWSIGHLPNVWIGTSVEDRKALARIDVLRGIPAAVRFLSIEPLLEDLGTIDLTGISWVIVGGESGGMEASRELELSWVRSIVRKCQAASVPAFVKQMGSRPVIPYYERDGASPEDHAWAQSRTRAIIRHDEGLQTLHNIRLHGQPPPFSLRVIQLADKGGDMDEWPADLRVREFPNPQL